MLDGEMVSVFLQKVFQNIFFLHQVIDVVNGKKFPRFLVYDIIRYEGNEVSLLPNDDLCTHFCTFTEGQ